MVTKNSAVSIAWEMKKKQGKSDDAVSEKFRKQVGRDRGGYYKKIWSEKKIIPL